MKSVLRVLTTVFISGFIFWYALSLMGPLTGVFEQLAQQNKQTSSDAETHRPLQLIPQLQQALQSGAAVEKAQPKAVYPPSETKPVPQKPISAIDEQKRRLARLKESIWQQVYQRPKKCLNITSRQRLTECGNHYILQKREFEAKWQQGFFDSHIAAHSTNGSNPKETGRKIVDDRFTQPPAE